MKLNIPEYGEYIRVNYMGAQYASEPYAVMKFTCMVIYVFCSLLFFFSGKQDQCPLWVYFVFHSAMLISAILIALLYMATVLKVGLCCPLIWIYTDTIICCLCALFILIASVISMVMQANNNSAAAVLAILAALLLTVTCAVMHVKTHDLWQQTIHNNKTENI